MTLGFEEMAWVGKALGLRMEPAEDGLLVGRMTLDGTVDGIRVHVHHWRGEFVHVEITAYLDPPADFTFRIQPAGIFDKIASFFGGHDIEVGEKAFDDAFEIGSEEPARALALLTPALRQTLMGWKDLRNFDVREDRVSFWTIPGSYSTMEATVLREAVVSLVGLARVTSTVIPGAPPSARLSKQIDAWRTHAQQHGLAFVASPLRMGGKIAGAAFSAHVVAVRDGGHGVEIGTTFEERLPFFLRISPARWRDVFRREAEGAPAKTGDAAFDDAFRVITSEPAKATAFLDDDVRRALLGLTAEEGDLVVWSEGISLRTKRLVPPDAFDQIFGRLAVVAAKLHSSAGPYR